MSEQGGDGDDGDGEHSDDEAHKGQKSRRVLTLMQRAAVAGAYTRSP